MQALGIKTDKMRRIQVFFFFFSPDSEGYGRKSGSSGFDAMWFVSGLHSYTHDPGCALTGKCLPSCCVQGLVTGAMADACPVIKG